MGNVRRTPAAGGQGLAFFKELLFAARGALPTSRLTRAMDWPNRTGQRQLDLQARRNWAITDWFRFRGSYGPRSAPRRLFEQFLADETSFPTARHRSVHPRRPTSQRATSPAHRRQLPGGGNPGQPLRRRASRRQRSRKAASAYLKPETSKALVAGGILTPKFRALPNTRISLAIDYFNIKVNSEVSQLGARNICSVAINSMNFPTDPLCSLFTRGPPSNRPIATPSARRVHQHLQPAEPRPGFHYPLIQHNMGAPRHSGAAWQCDLSAGGQILAVFSLDCPSPSTKQRTNRRSEVRCQPQL